MAVARPEGMGNTGQVSDAVKGSLPSNSMDSIWTPSHNAAWYTHAIHGRQVYRETRKSTYWLIYTCPLFPNTNNTATSRLQQCHRQHGDLAYLGSSWEPNSRQGHIHYPSVIVWQCWLSPPILNDAPTKIHRDTEPRTSLTRRSDCRQEKCTGGKQYREPHMPCASPLPTVFGPLEAQTAITTAR